MNNRLPFIFQTAFLILAVFFTWIWTNHPTLSLYNLQLTALLIILYFAARLLSKQKAPLIDFESALILSTITLLLIFSTGGLDSPLFFLLDFLLFALALLFSPLQTALTAAVIAVIFIAQLPAPTDAHITNLLSLILITPLAILFGNRFIAVKQAKGDIKKLEGTIAHEETQTLLWLSTTSKPQLTISLDLISQVISTRRLPASLQEKLKEAYRKLLDLYQSADQLEHDIDQASEN